MQPGEETEYPEKIDYPRILFLIVVSVVINLALRWIAYSPYSKTAAFYIALPLFISILLYWTAPNRQAAPPLKQSLGRHMGEATYVFLLTSFFMLEGFICVLLTAPVYYLIVGVSHTAWAAFSKRADNRAQRIKAYSLPAIILILSLEGVSVNTTLDRHNQVTYTTTVSASVSVLKANMAEPITFEQSRHWFLKIFPSPVSVEAGSLKAGDTHRINFVYNRWFFTNTHKGDMTLYLKTVEENLIETQIVDNSSYLASYMSIDGTRVQFKPLKSGQTQVSLTIFYQRQLDPSWYFGPLQEFAVSKSAQYLVETIITKTPTES